MQIKSYTAAELVGFRDADHEFRYWNELWREINAAFRQRDTWRHYHPGRFWGPCVESGTMVGCSPGPTIDSTAQTVPATLTM